MKRNLIKMSVPMALGVVTLLLVSSCEKADENEFVADEQAQSEIEYVDGPKVIVGSESLLKSATSTYGPWTTVTRDHLNKFGSYFTNTDGNKNRFTAVLGKGPTRPRNVSVNDVKFGSGTNASQKNNWNVDFRTVGKRIGKPKTSSKTPIKQIAGFSARRMVNRSNKGRWMNVPNGEWAIETSNTRSWNVSGTISTEVGGNVGIPLVSEGSVKVTVSLTAGGSGSNSRVLKENLSSTRIWVPARKTAVFQPVERHRTITTKWQVPIQFRGFVGADYGKKHHGHHFWGVNANRYFYEYTDNNRSDYKYYTIDVKEETLKEMWVRAWVE